MFEECRAYQFECDLSLPDLLDKLNAEGTREWIMRDSHWYGDYISSIEYREYEGDEEEEEEKLKIYEEEDNYAVTIFFCSNQSDAEMKWNRLHNYVMNKLFPVINAKKIEPTEYFD